MNISLAKLLLHPSCGNVTPTKNYHRRTFLPPTKAVVGEIVGTGDVIGVVGAFHLLLHTRVG